MDGTRQPEVVPHARRKGRLPPPEDGRTFESGGPVGAPGTSGFGAERLAWDGRFPDGLSRELDGAAQSP